ncbi:hypothetical protein ATANTOWER_022740 [Ataeniobius toweri]|uniref:Secreted protein n=1 Tax=Ataeniobius toweri TaxID=208326 RepID=A0ABU7CCT5_9TELE|nr:hypothetical protein [Ataeniobius toweri]
MHIFIQIYAFLCFWLLVGTDQTRGNNLCINTENRKRTVGGCVNGFQNSSINTIKNTPAGKNIPVISRTQDLCKD